MSERESMEQFGPVSVDDLPWALGYLDAKIGGVNTDNDTRAGLQRVRDILVAVHGSDPTK